MSDIKPLRHGDYLAMAEQNRRSTAALKALEALQEKLGKPDRSLMWIVVLISLIATAILGVAGSRLSGFIQAPKKEACYFTKKSSDSGEDPWNQKWEVIRSDGSNHRVENIDGEFLFWRSQQEAWDFIQSWNLKACK